MAGLDVAVTATTAPRARRRPAFVRFVVRVMVVGGGTAGAVALAASAAFATSAPTFTSTPASGGDTSPTWTWSAPGAVAQECEFTYVPTSTVIDGPAPCSATYTIAMSGRPTGAYN